MRGRHQRGSLWGVALLAVLAVLIAGWALLAPKTAPSTPTKSVAVPQAALCLEYARVLVNTAGRLDGAFAQHARAHHDYQQKKIPFGPADQPGTVLYVWRKTLAQRERYSGQYRELRAAWQATCATTEASSAGGHSGHP